ncbi:MAG: T9SS type A sorting domain-containing protein [Bacteroidales bacterium]|nr:T9SS type A sorting domain-containing protein [Bacteroidales bacterium]
MKKYSFIAFFIFVSGLIQAQIPNAGFEAWTSMGSYEIPDSWGNMNAVTSSSGVYTTLKGSPGASGNHYIKLTTKDAGGTITPGVIVSGQLSSTTWLPVSGFPFNERVESLTGKYQYMGYNNDVATIAAWLTKWNTTLHRRDTIASLWTTTKGMIHVWTAFSIPFAYQSTAIPDTAVVMISSSSHTPVKNSFIWIDDLGFDGAATSVNDINFPVDVRVYPSPAKDEVTVTFNSRTGYSAKLRLLNLAGVELTRSMVEIQAGLNSIDLDLSNLHPSPGVYLIQLETPEGTLNRKIIIGM